MSGVLLTRDKLVSKMSRFETLEFDLSMIESFEIDAGRVIGCGWWPVWGAVNLAYMIFALRANRLEV